MSYLMFNDLRFIPLTQRFPNFINCDTLNYLCGATVVCRHTCRDTSDGLGDTLVFHEA
jgi:hypothetical protein